jgi:hypothetical protein
MMNKREKLAFAFAGGAALVGGVAVIVHCLATLS